MSHPEQSEPPCRGPLRFRWRVFGVFLILAAIAIMAIWTVVPPTYRATGFIFVESPSPKRPLEFSEQSTVSTELMDRFIADQATRVKDETLLRDVLKDAAVRETDWFRSKPNAEDSLRDLSENLRAAQVPQTSFVAISFAARNRRDAPVIVNTMISKLIAKTATEARAQYEVEIADYEKTEKALEAQLERIRSQKESFIATKLGAPGVTQGVNVIGETYRTLAAEVTRLEAEKLQYKAQYEKLAAMKPDQIAISPQMRQLIQQDPQIVKLQDLKLMQQLEIDTSRVSGSDSQPADSAQKARLEAIERRLGELTGAKEQEVREYMVKAAHTQYLNAVQAELDLRDRMLEVEAQQRDLDRGLAQLHSLEEEQRLLEGQLTRIRDYISQLGMIVSASGGVRVQRGSTAYEPTRAECRLQTILTLAVLAVTVLVGIPVSLTRTPR